MTVDEQKAQDEQVQKPDELLAPEIEAEAPLLEPEGLPDAKDAQNKVHPLTPGGTRFEQVYARGKQAERDAQKLREELAAANAKLEVLQGNKQPDNAAEKEYTWAELDEFIKQGRITLADAQAHREKVVENRLKRTIKSDFSKEATQTGRIQTLTHSVQEYLDAVPNILVDGSEERLRVDEEFNFLASVQGVDTSTIDDSQRKALQLTALRAVYGPVGAIVKKSVTTKTPDTQQERPGGIRPNRATNPDQVLIDGLSKSEVAHYNKMMLAGRYKGGWKEVAAELKFQAPKQVRR